MFYPSSSAVGISSGITLAGEGPGEKSSLYSVTYIVKAVTWSVDQVFEWSKKGR